MLAHSGRFLVMLAICVAGVVLARPLVPLIRSAGLLIGLLGAILALIVAATALCTVIFAGVAGWAGWDQAAGPFLVPGHPVQLRFLMAVLGVALAGALIVVALFVQRLRRGKRN